MYKSKHFKIEELVPPSIFNDHGEDCWQLFDDRAIKALDKLKNKFEDIVVNDWNQGGETKYCGFLPTYTKPNIGINQRRFGRGFIIGSNKQPINEIIEFMGNNPNKFKQVSIVNTGGIFLEFWIES